MIFNDILVKTVIQSLAFVYGMFRMWPAAHTEIAAQKGTAPAPEKPKLRAPSTALKLHTLDVFSLPLILKEM